MSKSKSLLKLPNSRILITGACGSVGSALVKRLLNEGHIVCAFDNNEDGLFKLDQEHTNRNEKLRIFLGDVRDIKRVRDAMERVDYVFHCAGLKHVYLSEYNPFEAVQTNVIGSNNIIKAALNANVSSVIFTSSDKAVNPTSTMGASKLLAERLFTSANYHAGTNKTKFAVVRFGNVLNTNGSILQIFQKQLNENQPLTITSTKMTRFFLTMSQSIDLCIKAAKDMIGGEIFIKNMGSCNIMTLAKIITGNTEKFNFVEVGCKPGEKLYEELITDVESTRTVAIKDIFVILPEVGNYSNETTQKCYLKYKNHKFVNKAIRSDTGLLDEDKVRSMLNNASLK